MRADFLCRLSISPDEVQEQGLAFERPEDLWKAVGLYELTQTSVATYLRGEGLSQRIISELVAAVNRVNYNQGNTLNALAGVVSLCPLVTGSTFTIKQGNGAIAHALVQHAATNIANNTAVDVLVIRRDPSSGKRLYDLRSGATTLGTFDAVVLATPLEAAHLKIVRQQQSGEEIEEKVQVPARTFQTTHTTWIRGTLQESFFTVSRTGRWQIVMRLMDRVVDTFRALRGKTLMLPDSVYLTEEGSQSPSVFFSSISHYSEFKIGGGSRGEGGGVGGKNGNGGGRGEGDMYKIFSSKALGDDEIEVLFGRRKGERKGGGSW